MPTPTIINGEQIDEGMLVGDIVRYVWMAFGNDRLTTKEVEQRLAELFDYHCPDDFAKRLTMFRQAGLVKGEVSMEKGGWVWWVDDECRSKNPDEVNIR